MDRYPEDEFPTRKILTIGGSVVVLVFAVITFFLGVFKIDETERGVITRYGRFSHIAQPGLNFRLPWVDSLTRIDVRESNPKFMDMEMYSEDQFPAKIDGSLVLSPKTDNESLKHLYNRYGTVENAIKVTFGPLMPADLKVVFGKFSAERAIKERDKLNLDAKARILSSLGTSPLFDVKNVLIEDIEFSKKYIESVEGRMIAEVEVQKVKQHWEKEKIAADIVKTKADAAAYEVEVKGKAEAAAIDLMGQALAKNPKYVEKLQAEKWDGKLPTTVLPSTAIPLIGMQKN